MIRYCNGYTFVFLFFGGCLKGCTIENNAGFQPHYTPTPLNTKIPTLDFICYAQTIFRGFAKVHKSAQFEIFALLFYKNGLMKQSFQLYVVVENY